MTGIGPQHLQLQPYAEPKWTAGQCRYCCKSPKLPGANFPAVKKSDRQPPIDVASITLPRSPANLSSGNEVPHIFTRKSRAQPKELLITSAKRLLQQNLPTTDLCIATEEGAMPSEIVKPSAFVVLKLTTSYELFRPSVSYPIAIRLRRSRREATSMRYVTSANTAHPPWNSTPAATTRPPGIGPMAHAPKGRQGW